MKTLTLALLGLAASCAAHAEPDTQWKPAHTTFATLVQSGYHVVAATDHTYLLQHEASVMSCPEPRGGSAQGAQEGGSPFACRELVEPYDSTAPQTAPTQQK